MTTSAIPLIPDPSPSKREGRKQRYSADLSAKITSLAQIGIWLLMLCLWPGQAAGADCAALFRQQKYTEAAVCFEKKAKFLGDTAKLSPTQRWAKGRLLRNAAACYKQAAHRASPVQAAFLREKALLLLNRYQREQMYENQLRRQEADRQIQSLRREIGYAILTIQVPGAAAQICIVGYQLRRCHQGQRWQVEVRPGALQISAQRGQQRTEVVKLTLAPGSNVVQTLRWKTTPPARRRPVPKQTMVQLQIQSKPAGATVSLAGRSLGKTPLFQTVANKTQALHFTLPCYVKQTYVWKKSAPLSITVTLQRSPAYMQWLAAQQSSGTSRIWGWTVLATGIAAVTLGTVGQIVASVRHAEAQKQKQAYDNAQTLISLQNAANAYEQNAETGNTWRTVSYVGFGVGAAAVGVGLGRLLTIPSNVEPPCARDK